MIHKNIYLLGTRVSTKPRGEQSGKLIWWKILASHDKPIKPHYFYNKCDKHFVRVVRHTRNLNYPNKLKKIYEIAIIIV